jgi:hypothetical protein
MFIMINYNIFIYINRINIQNKWTCFFIMHMSSVGPLASSKKRFKGLRMLYHSKAVARALHNVADVRV